MTPTPDEINALVEDERSPEEILATNLALDVVPSVAHLWKDGKAEYAAARLLTKMVLTLAPALRSLLAAKTKAEEERDEARNREHNAHLAVEEERALANAAEAQRDALQRRLNEAERVIRSAMAAYVENDDAVACELVADILSRFLSKEPSP